MSYARQAVTRLTLNMAIPVVQKSVSCTVGDVNRRLEVTLIDRGEPFALPPDWTAFLAGIKPDGTRLANSCVVDRGRIIYDFAGGAEIATSPGVFTVVFEVYDGLGELVATPKVWVHVADNAGARIVNSADQFSVLSELIGKINGAQADADELNDKVGDLLDKATSAGTVTIPMTEWTDGSPTVANVQISGVDMGSIILMLPADEETRLTANSARLSVYPIAFTPTGGDSSVSIFRAEAEEVPDADMTFAYIVLKTGFAITSPIAAIIGVDAYGEGGGDAVPAYITAEAERVAKAVQATRTAKSLVFPVMSDMHLYAGNSLETHENSLVSAQYAGMGVRELKKRIHLDFTAYLGDYTWGADTYTAEQVMKDITAVKETTDTTGEEIWVVGNHDLNCGKDRDRLLTLDEVFSHIGANSDGVKPYSSIERGYGYLDFDNQKIRAVYLNTCDTSEWKVTEGQEVRADWISPTQIQWLADTALDFSDKEAPSEWGVVVLGHHPLHYGASCYDSVMQILEAYRDGLAGSLSCTVRVDTADDGAVTYPQQVVTYDFSAGDRAEIICNIHGHNHNCGYSQISSTTRTGSTSVTPWLWRFCIPNISANRYNTGKDVGELYAEYDANGSLVYHEKEPGTAKATSFCVVNIDRKNKKIYAHIFGAGCDRVMDYAESYVNQLDAAGYTPDTYLSSSSGNTSTKAGYVTTGFIPIGYGSSNTGTGEQVVYLDNIEALPTDNYVRIAIYDADKSFISLAPAPSMYDTPTESSVMRTLDENGNIKSIDVTAFTSYYHKNQGKTTAFFRFCAPGIDGDSIITVNEPINL